MKITSLAAGLGILASALPGAAAEFDYIGRLGLYEVPEFIRQNDGHTFSALTHLTESGFLAGSSTRYDGDTMVGEAAWVAMSNGDTFRAGLYQDGPYTGPLGYQRSTVFGIAESGYVWGTSQQYNGLGEEVGSRPWVSHASTGISTPIGLAGEEFTRNSDGMTNIGVGDASSSVPMTATGYLIGHSARYQPVTSATNGRAAWVASAGDRTTNRVGLYVGPEFVRSSDGFQSSTVFQITESGIVRGQSTRFDFGTTQAGQAAWIASKSGGATRIGFHSTPEFTRSNGNYEESVGTAMNEAGQIIGHSLRYEDTESRGQAAWRATFSSTERLGLYGEETIYRSPTLGTEYSLVQKLTEGGSTSGYSYIYDQETGEQRGQAAWVANLANVYRVGFVGAEYTAPGGFQNSVVHELVDGFATGISSRYHSVTGDDLGQAAWIAEVGGSSIRLGNLSMRNDGYEHSSIGKPTESGHVFGSTRRYGGSVFLGNIAWTASASTGFTTRVVGLEGPEFDRDDGYASSAVSGISESGLIVGTTNRYFANAGAGSAAWVAQVGEPGLTRIGLYGTPEFTRGTDNYEFTGAMNGEAANPAEFGYVVGFSNRYDGATANGQATWAMNLDYETVRTGLVDATHTSSTGFQYSAYTEFTPTETGLVAGFSRRYDGITHVGQTAWIYDIPTDQHVAFELSVRPSDNYAFSTIVLVGGTGFAIGRYQLFDGETDLGDRAFAYLPGRGAFDIGENLSPSLDEAGWEAFLLANFGNTDGFIAGQGTPSDGPGQGIYLVNANAIPEPSTVALLLGAGVLGWAARRVRSKRCG